MMAFRGLHNGVPYYVTPPKPAVFRNIPLTLVLWSDDTEVCRQLRERAAAYKASGNSGLDLNVFAGEGSRTNHHNWFLLSTRTYAKLVSDERPNECYAFYLNARSSLPGRGWMLGNGTGLIDRVYCDPIKASLIATAPSGCDTVEDLCGPKPIVQLVSPDAQPFDEVYVCASRLEWLALLESLWQFAPDRGGGFGSTDATLSPGSEVTGGSSCLTVPSESTSLAKTEMV